MARTYLLVLQIVAAALLSNSGIRNWHGSTAPYGGPRHTAC